jgi:hypothetical protein
MGARRRPSRSRLAARRRKHTDHTYSSQDIAAGAQDLFVAVPALSRAERRAGQRRRSAARTIQAQRVGRDIAAVITNGVAGAGMPPFKFQPAEITTILAFIRAGFDPSGVAVKVGNVSRGKALYAGKQLRVLPSH